MNDTNFSLGRIILLTYIIIGSNYCSDLFSPELKNAIKNNRLVQHRLCFVDQQQGLDYLVEFRLFLWKDFLDFHHSQNSLKSYRQARLVPT